MGVSEYSNKGKYFVPPKSKNVNMRMITNPDSDQAEKRLKITEESGRGIAGLVNIYILDLFQSAYKCSGSYISRRSI
jgi:hypothetical protein